MGNRPNVPQFKMGTTFSKMEGYCPWAWGKGAWDAGLAEMLKIEAGTITDDDLEDPPSSDDEGWRYICGVALCGPPHRRGTPEVIHWHFMTSSWSPPCLRQTCLRTAPCSACLHG